MSDIAEKAGVSRSTVSLVLSGRHEALRISDATYRRVIDAATALGYRPNEIARAVATGKNRALGFLAFHPTTEFASAMLAGAIEEAETHGYLIKVMRLAGDATDQRVVQRCVESRLAGVVCVYLQDAFHEELRQYGVPTVRLDSSSEEMSGIRVISDDIMGNRQAVAHLVALGHRQIGFVGGEESAATSRLREQGYRLGMEEQALTVPMDYVGYGNWDIPTTAAVVQRMLTRQPDRPTALLCANDYIAMVTLRTARGLGLRVPEDLSVVGFADLTLAQYGDPPLTTVAQPFEEMGRRAVHCLLSDGPAADPDGAAAEHRLPTRLIVRGSTGVCVDN